MVIVYRSNTGFTQEYAEMLGKAEKMKVFSVAEAEDGVPPGENVFYMGPLMAGHISGVDQAVKKFTVKGVCGVGMSLASQQLLDALAKANYVPNAPIFYLQGGWAPRKVSWLKRRMVNMVTKSNREALQAKGSRRTPEESKQLDILLHGGSWVSFERLDTIRSWMKRQRV
ncbi:hypothetical protein D1646_11845 [Pseudoflavonifractor sp. 60]|uniref:hypothetical protein n=1 Tax=Pseudoflavonifractor sp. 60 TaxID=2304576 RepID=UPI001367EAE1|nr:hypothetical protein [Pseudoflavonifractor sp. 60]NBI67490.1 hypothetical protein [Pseudoflavonifractor sp. 60]